MPFDSIELNDGHKIPAIGYGTGSKMKFHDVTEYVEQAIDIGFDHIDTAAFYGTEQYVGKAVKESGLARSELFITTKYLFGDPIPKSILKSLSKLGLEYVDLYLIHNPRFIKDLPSAWKAFEKIKKDGLAKSIGVSNFNDAKQLEDLVKIANIRPAVNQIMLHPYNHAEMKPVLDVCAKYNITVEAYSSLAPITTYPGGPVDKPVAAAAKRIGATPTQVIFLWVKAKGGVIVTTTSRKEHMEEYLAVAELPPLTEDEVAAIDEAGSKGPPTDIVSRFRALSTRFRAFGGVVVSLFLVLIASKFCSM